MNGLPTIFGYGASANAVRVIRPGMASNDAAFQARREEAARIRRAMTGHCEQDVTAALQKRYHPETFLQLKFNHGVQTHNRLGSDVLSKLAVGWQQGASYSLIGPDNAPVEDPAFPAFIKAMDVDNRMRAVEALVFQHRAVLVAPTVVHDDATGQRRFVLEVYTPEHFNLIPAHEDRTGYTAVVLYGQCYHNGRAYERRVTWTHDEYTEEESADGQRWTVEDRGPNPYKIIPATVFRMSAPVDSPWVESFGEMLAEKTIEANCWETVLGFKGSSQIKVLAGQFTAFPPGQNLRDAGVVNIGDAENIQTLDFQTDLAGFARVMIDRLRQQAAVTVGLGADEFEQTGVPPSGEALKMRYWKRDQVALLVRHHLVESLRQLYWVALTVAWHELKAVGKTDTEGEVIPPISNLTALPPYLPDQPDAYKIQVDPAEIAYPELAQEIQNRTDWMLQKGLTSRAELMQRENPDLDPAQAQAAVRANLLQEAEYSNPGRMALAERRAAAVAALTTQPVEGK